MSGPKDFVVIFAIARLAQMQQRRHAEAAVRAEAVAEHLRASRLRAREIRSEAARAAKESQTAAITQQRSANARSLAAAKQAADDAAADDKAQEVAAVSEQAIRLEESVHDVIGWQEALRDDAAVGSFRAADAAAWLQRSEALLRETTGGAGMPTCLARAEALNAEAEALHREAGEIKGKFDTRNELLNDIIASLKEIGFFVYDPHYEKPQDPSGPVIIKAVRGDEEMTASVDLSETVKSVWNGIADDRCKESFFDYVDQMKSRGVDVKAQRDDLRERPILKRKGANELPRSTSTGH